MPFYTLQQMSAILFISRLKQPEDVRIFSFSVIISTLSVCLRLPYP